MQYTLKEVEFSEVLPIWSIKLWPGRESPIKAMSSMTLDETYDMEIYDKYNPYFWAIFCGNEIVAVNSGHQTSDTEFRSRGLYADPEHRGKGLAKQVLNATISRAKELGMKTVWTVPRQASMPAYESVGFERVSDWFDEGVEFGPNCYAIYKI